jgi:hypothetical protein
MALNLGHYAPRGFLERLQHRDLADEIQQEFLCRFPAHALAPDMYFAEAMRNAVKADYAQALSLLGQLVTCYPGHRLREKAERVRTRLRYVTSPAIDRDRERR